jgi:hypothetical protein
VPPVPRDEPLAGAGSLVVEDPGRLVLRACVRPGADLAVGDRDELEADVAEQELVARPPDDARLSERLAVKAEGDREAAATRWRSVGSAVTRAA